MEFSNISCEGHSFSMSLTNRNQLTVIFSFLQFNSVAGDLAKAMLWIMSTAAVFLNVAVVTWRLRSSRRESMSPVSFLIINLATADCIVAFSKIFYLLAMMTVRNVWCKPANHYTKTLCISSIVASHEGVALRALILSTIALLAIKDYIGCCGRPQSTSLSAIVIVVIFEWFLSVAFSGVTSWQALGSLLLREANFNKSIDWLTCWTFNNVDVVGHLTVDIASMSSFCAVMALATVAYVTIAVAMLKGKIGDAPSSSSSSSRNQLGVQLLFVAFLDGVLVLCFIIWNGYLLANYKSVETILRVFNTTATAFGFILPLSVLVNPLLFTLLKSSFVKKKMKTLQGIFCRCDQWRPNETTRLFPDTTKLFPETTNSTNNSLTSINYSC